MASVRRYTKRHPCPICEGWDDRRLGEARCWGAIFDDTRALCKRVQSRTFAELDGTRFYVHFLREPDPPPSSTGPPRNGSARKGKPWPAAWDEDTEAIYPYHHDGDELYQVVRRRGKKIIPRHRAGDGWELGYGLDPQTQTVLYHQDEALAALRVGETLYICEGEKDVDAVVEAGGVATTNPGGTGLGFRPHHARAIAAAHEDGEIIIIADRDEPGLRHAKKVHDALLGEGVPRRFLSIVRAESGKDAYDHLASGARLSALVPLDDSELEPVLSSDERLARVFERGAPELVTDLGETIIEPPRPFLIPGFLPAGVVGLVVGAGGTGKGYFLMQLALALGAGYSFGTLTVPETAGVLILSKEDDQAELRRRWGRTVEERFGEGYVFDHFDTDNIRRNVHVLDLSSTPDCYLDASLAAHLSAYTRRHSSIRLIAIDPIGKFLSPEAPELNSQEGAAHLANQLAAIQALTGCTVLGVHHTNKAPGDKLSVTAATGSKQLTDYVRWVCNLERLEDDHPKISQYALDPQNAPYVIGAVTKSNYTAQQKEALIWCVGKSGALRPMPRVAFRGQADNIIIEALRAWDGGCERSKLYAELREEHGLGRDRVQGAMARLVAEGSVIRFVRQRKAHFRLNLRELPERQVAPDSPTPQPPTIEVDEWFDR